jgi:hypothetical protein
MPLSKEAAQLRGQLANRSRFHPDEDHTELRAELKARRLEDHIRAVVDSAPPLTAEQRDRLALILRGGGDA